MEFKRLIFFFVCVCFPNLRSHSHVSCSLWFAGKCLRRRQRKLVSLSEQDKKRVQLMMVIAGESTVKKRFMDPLIQGIIINHQLSSFNFKFFCLRFANVFCFCYLQRIFQMHTSIHTELFSSEASPKIRQRSFHFRSEVCREPHL